MQKIVVSTYGQEPAGQFESVETTRRMEDLAIQAIINRPVVRRFEDVMAFEAAEKQDENGTPYMLVILTGDRKLTPDLRDLIKGIAKGKPSEVHHRTPTGRISKNAIQL